MTQAEECPDRQMPLDFPPPPPHAALGLYEI
jgi:hypothetical protein